MATNGFGNQLTGSSEHAIQDAQGLSDANGSPVGVWARDGWYTVCETDPESIEPAPESIGWTLWAVVDPTASA